MSGNRKEFENLFQEYKRYVYAICYKYCSAQQDALDLTQEVFVKVLKNWDGVDKSRDVKPWIRKVTVNTCMNFQRDRRETLSLDCDTDGTRLIDMLPAREDTEETVLGHLGVEQIDRCIRELSPDIQTAVILRHKEGLSYREISEIMKRPEGTIKTYLYKGRRMLARCLSSRENGR